MRILFVNNFSSVTGGADRHCFDLAHVLRERGHEVRLLATRDEEPEIAEGGFLRLQVTNATRDGLSPAASARVAMSALYNRSARRAADRLLADFRPDVVHAHKCYPQLSVAPILAAADAGVPVVQTLHDYEFIAADPYDSAGGWFDRRADPVRYRALTTAMLQVRQRIHAPRVAAWVGVSRALAEPYARRGIDAHVIPNFTLLQPPPSGRETRNGLLYCGRLSPEKGLDVVVRVAEILPAVPVRVAGAGPLEPFVRDAAERLENLEYVGVLSGERVAEAMGRAHAVLMPAQWAEPGPLACLEAMACGTPVVASDRGGLAEYVRDAGAGFVTPGDAGSVAAAAHRLIDDDALWKEVSRSAFAAREGAHSPQTYARAIEDTYVRAARRG